MKKMMMMGFVAATAAALFVVSSAHAIVMPGWERPISQAKMSVIASSDEYAQVQNVRLTMTQQDGFKKPTGFILLIDGQQKAVEFKIVKVIDDRTQGAEVTHYIAVPQKSDETPGRVHILDRDFYRLDVQEVQENGNSRWEAVLKNANAVILKLAGKPETVFTIQMAQ